MTSIDQVIKIYTANIKKARSEKAVTQAFVAEKVGVTDKYISDIETGRKPCSLDVLIAIANALDVEPYKLLMPQGEVQSYDSQKTRIVMKRLKESFTEMVDSLSLFLEEQPGNS